MTPIPRHGCRYLLAIVCVVTLSACATGRAVDSPADILDDGKRNSVLFSYDIVGDSFDRRTGVDSSTFKLRCAGEGALAAGRICFEFELPYAGQQVDGVVVHRFEQAGVRPYQMKYGDYRIESGDHQVVIGRTPDVQCYTDKKGRTRCNTTYVDEYENHGFVLPEPLDFRVTPGSGCYLGHVTIQVRGNQVLDWQLDREMAPAVFDGLAPGLRQRSAQFIDRPCA